MLPLFANYANMQITLIHIYMLQLTNVNIFTM